MSSFDYIFAGGGAAALSLAYRITRSPLKNKSMLIIDQEEKNKNDRTWSFWTKRPLIFEPVVHRSWNQLQFISDDFQKQFSLSPYVYKTIRGIDFYHFVLGELKKFPNIQFENNRIIRIEDDEIGARVVVSNGYHDGQWVFDSMFLPGEFHPQSNRFHYLKQHFRGWVIRTSKPSFDPQTFTMFDFRTPQNGAMRFVYVLPFSNTQALVEYTLFSAELLSDKEYDQGIHAYIQNILKISDYVIEEVEAGNIPMSDHPFARKTGKNILAIGTKGGRVKPSTGYAFMRIQNDSDQILESLVHHNHPFHLSSPNPLYLFNDSIMLQLMYRQGDAMKGIFTSLFKNSPIDRLFRFLDEEAAMLDNLGVMASLNPYPFLQAWYRLKILKKL